MTNRKNEGAKKVQKRVRKRMKPCPLWGSSSAPVQIRSENRKKAERLVGSFPSLKGGELANLEMRPGIEK
jgi:hypothetical protein